MIFHENVMIGPRRNGFIRGGRGSRKWDGRNAWVREGLGIEEHTYLHTYFVSKSTGRLGHTYLGCQSNATQRTYSIRIHTHANGTNTHGKVEPQHHQMDLTWRTGSFWEFLFFLPFLLLGAAQPLYVSSNMGLGLSRCIMPAVGRGGMQSIFY